MIDPTFAEFARRHDLTAASVTELWNQVQQRMRAEVDAVVAEEAAGGAVPTVDFADIANGDVQPALPESIRRRGCVIIRGTFDRSQVEAWDEQLGGYLAVNRFDEVFAERYPDAPIDTKLWAIYWSKPQVEARQHPSMQVARRFLNSFWTHDVDGTRWFDPDSDIGYPDRIRRRAPGSSSPGLPLHSDAVSSSGWRVAENEAVFRAVLAGSLDDFDPWSAAHRTTVGVDSAAPSTVFRTFQGWTALSEMRPEDGVLHLLPIPTAAAYMLVRGLAREFGVLDERGPAPAPKRFRADPLLVQAVVPIPAVEPGDTVWWHGDIIHSVAPATNDERWGNVMYIGAAPVCPRNDDYRVSALDRFVAGRSPVDFPADDLESTFAGRGSLEDLNDTGRGFLGLDPIDTAAPRR